MLWQTSRKIFGASAVFAIGLVNWPGFRQTQNPQRLPTPPPARSEQHQDVSPQETVTTATDPQQKLVPSITIAAVGDVMIGSTYPDDSELPPNDGKDLMAPFTSTLHAADLTFGNLEGPILEGGVSSKCPAPPRPSAADPSPKVNCFAFRVPTRYATDLTAAGFNVMSLANNHAGDFGDAGRASTRHILDEQGIRYIGSDRRKFATTVIEVRGTKVGLVGFAHNDIVPNVNDLAFARQLVSELKTRADIVVVSFHGGGEGIDHQHVLPLGTTEMFYKEPRGDLRAFTHAVIDAGADLVIGHGPHVLRGMEIYKGHLIAYSMGNFCTYGMFALHDETALTAVFRLNIGLDGRFLGGQLVPGRQNKPGGPTPDPSGEAIHVIRRLSIEDFGGNAPKIADDGSFF